MPVTVKRRPSARIEWLEAVSNEEYAAAQANGITAITPKIGQVFNILDEALPQEK